MLLFILNQDFFNLCFYNFFFFTNVKPPDWKFNSINNCQKLQFRGAPLGFRGFHCCALADKHPNHVQIRWDTSMIEWHHRQRREAELKIQSIYIQYVCNWVIQIVQQTTKPSTAERINEAVCPPRLYTCCRHQNTT